ncbi:hypothetical protein DBR42_02235 [Pelomonas sp. HMWF004]|nr:hypothetical protein DBR42_02235 [Pelomonas sp. HMWF004]
MNMMQRLQSLPEIHLAADKAVVQTVHAYFAELYETEVRDKSVMESGEDHSEYLSQSIAEKTVIHRKYWSNPALFYVPCSISGAPRHNWSLLSNIEIFRNDDDDNRLFIFSAKYPFPSGGLSNRVYMLRVVDGALKFEHEFM